MTLTLTLTAPIRVTYLAKWERAYMKSYHWSRLRHAHGTVLLGNRVLIYPRWRWLWALHDWWCFKSIPQQEGN